MSDKIRWIDPLELRLPASRAAGADPWKLHQQIRAYGATQDGMPPIIAWEDPNGLLEIFDGVTRATRIAKLAPGELVPVQVTGNFRHPRSNSERLKDIL